MNNNIIIYTVIIFSILIFYSILQIIRSNINSYRERKDFRWKEKEIASQEQKKAKNIEDKKYNNSKIHLENQFMLAITNKSRIILFGGEPGSGKSITMNLFAKWLYDRQEYLDNKSFRYNTYIRPEYIKEKQRLLDEDLLNVYDNLGFTLNNLKTQDVLPAITMLKKASERAILVLDEAGHYFPKEKYFEILKTKNIEARAEYDRLVEFVRFIRHYINGYLLLTEQDEENIVVGVRRTGYARVIALQTWVYLTKKGKSLSKMKNNINKWMPALFVGKPIQSIMGKRGLLSKTITALKMFLPNYLNPFPYYEKSDLISKNVAKKHTEYKVLLQYGKNQQYLIFKNNNIFKYSTRARRGDYSLNFNSNGFAKGENNA